MHPMNDEFYVGYQPKAPASLARRVARIVARVVLGGLMIGVLLVFGQSPFAASKFEFGVYRDYAGMLEEWPYPILVTGESRYLLVAPGKHGFSTSVKGSVRLKGALIQRGPDAMLEVLPGSVQAAAAAPDANQVLDLGLVKLIGEIVDSKCYLGVMNPGNGKVHRDCAVRCISGGIPPAFIAKDASGEVRTLLLAGPDGRAVNREVLPFVAEPIEVSGELVRAGSTLVLRADPSSFRHSPE
jgi:hypothetical protein